MPLVLWLHGLSLVFSLRVGSKARIAFWTLRAKISAGDGAFPRLGVGSGGGSGSRKPNQTASSPFCGDDCEGLDFVFLAL